MGKYMKSIKKSSSSSNGDFNDVVCGVHTRSKALSLRRGGDDGGGGGYSSYSYIQLRSRPVMKRLKIPPTKSRPDPILGTDNLSLCVEAGDRTTRETTPCSLVKVPDVLRTPESSTRPATSAKGNYGNSMQLQIPTVNEMDKFFTRAEEEHQRQFIEKYNFDPVNEKPLLGRYEWARVDPCS